MQAMVEKNGDVTFIANPQERKEIGEMLEHNGGNDTAFLSDLLEFFGFSTNGKYMPVAPEDVGALTDAPMFTDELDIGEDGQIAVQGDVFWYPNYMVQHFGHQIAQKGRVTFSKAVA